MVVLPCTNAEGKEYDPKFKPVSLGEFYRWIGFWWMMLVVRRPECRCYWGSIKSSFHFTADFGICMTRDRFEDILIKLLAIRRL
eukprot:Pgem_evm2s12785